MWRIAMLTLPSAAPLAPILDRRIVHAARGRAQPAGGSPAKVLQNGLPLARATQVHITGLPTHHAQQFALVLDAAQMHQLDAAAVRGQPPHHPTLMYLQTRVGYPHRPADDLRILQGPAAPF